jgi:hypothetical protein
MFNSWIVERTNRLLLRFIQGIGMILGFLMVLTEFLADMDLFFTISSGLIILLTICLLSLQIFTLWSHPVFWRWLLIIFVLNIGFSIYLLYLGILGLPISEFRIVDFLVTVLSQMSICFLAINTLKL